MHGLDNARRVPYLSYSTHLDRSTTEMPDTEDEPSVPDDQTFEETLERLEEIVEQLEDDPPSLNDALEMYEEGVALANDCLARLEEAEQRVSELSIDRS